MPLEEGPERPVKCSLYELWHSDTMNGERNLARHLFEYLHDQGLDFSIEPSCIGGEPDLVAAQNSDEPIIVEAKVLKDKTSKLEIVQWFTQIYNYTLKFNEPMGYLVIYKVCTKHLNLALTNVEQSIPYAIYNNKTIFFVTIDITDYPVQISESAKPKGITITNKDLFGEIESNQ